MSRPRHPRLNYVIGIASLLALSENVYPDYYKNMSALARSFIGNPLAFGLATAIALSLLFRLTTRQRATTTWRAGDGGVETALAFLRSTAEAWTIPRKVVEEASEEIRGVIERMGRAHRMELGGELRLSTDGLDFVAKVSCHAEVEAALTGPSAASQPPNYVINDEEAALVAGLHTFLESLAAERKRLVLYHGRTAVVLSYGI
jgi:hypothetical protein